MVEETYATLKKRVSENLNARRREFAKCVGDINRNFRDLGLETGVWHPEMIYKKNVGGLDAESYLGYSRIEGKWGLTIRTIERDSESKAFVSQRVYPLESSGDVEIVVNALKKARELLRYMAKTTDRSIDILTKIDAEIDQLRNQDCRF